MRQRVRDAKGVATCLAFGPRLLHLTEQLYKGGPYTGVFLQITRDDAVDLPVPGQRYALGVVKAAQTRGDFAVLSARARRHGADERRPGTRTESRRFAYDLA